MSSEAPLPAETEPRSITNLNGNPILVDFEQKVAALETKRLEGLDRAIILEEKLSGLEAKVLALEKEKEEAIAFSKAKAAEFDQVSSKLRELEKRNSSNPEPLVAASKQDADQAPKSDERIAELEAKNKTLEQKILKNNAQKQAFAEQFDKLEEQLAQSQVQSKILLEKIAYLEGSGTREQYSRLEQQFKELEAEKTAAVERIKLLESTGQSPESLASLIAKVEQLEKANIAEIEKSAGLEEKLTTSAASFQSQIQELKAQNEDLQKLKVLEKQLADEKSVSKSLQETLAYTFDSDIKDKEAQAQKVAKLNEELKIARETATAEKELAIQLNEKLLSAEKEALAASNIEQQLHKVTEQLQLSETRVMLQIEKSVTEKKTLIALFDEEKAVLNKKLDEIGERLKVAEDTLQIEREVPT